MIVACKELQLIRADVCINSACLIPLFGNGYKEEFWTEEFQDSDGRDRVISISGIKLNTAAELVKSGTTIARI